MVGEDDAFYGCVVCEEERREDFDADGGECGGERGGWERDVLGYALDVEERILCGLNWRVHSAQDVCDRAEVLVVGTQKKLEMVGGSE